MPELRFSVMWCNCWYLRGRNVGGRNLFQAGSLPAVKGLNASPVEDKGDNCSRLSMPYVRKALFTSYFTSWLFRYCTPIPVDSYSSYDPPPK